MSRFNPTRTVLGLALALLPSFLWADAAARLTAPPGFKVSVYAEGLGSARGMALSPEGVLYVCDMDGGKVLALAGDTNKQPDEQSKVIIQGLHHPHSLAFYNGKIYVGETDRVSSFTPSEERLAREDGQTIVELPPGGRHSTRTILFGPDGKLYVSIGSSNDHDPEEDERRASIWRCNPDGTQFEMYTKGLRNAVGITFKPGTQDLWASCNGRDWLGDNMPPECIYQVEQGANYGWPDYYFLNGKAIKDNDSHRQVPPPTGVPVFEYQAHCAPLGIHFYTGSVFPMKYRQGLFICFHGSWNRSVPVGYKVVFLPILGKKKAGKAEDFLTGFKSPDYGTMGRPVDVLTGPKGELFISDDHGGRIFKVAYEGKEPIAQP